MTHTLHELKTARFRLCSEIRFQQRTGRDATHLHHDLERLDAMIAEREPKCSH